MSAIEGAKTVTDLCAAVIRRVRAMDEFAAGGASGCVASATLCVTISRSLGVVVPSSYKAHLDTDAINVRMAGPEAIDHRNTKGAVEAGKKDTRVAIEANARVIPERQRICGF